MFQIIKTQEKWNFISYLVYDLRTYERTYDTFI